MSKTVDLGPVSAYALAVKYGYSGTEAEWVAEMESKRLEAVTAASNAQSAATEASQSNTESANSAKVSADSATASANSASEASDSATLAESYTHGSTGTREGEDTDNARYYMEQAKSVSAVDVATTEIAGIVKPDGETITVDEDGTLHGSSSVDEMTGATEEKDGTSGTVPAPVKGQQSHILNGDGTWTSPLDNAIISAKIQELNKAIEDATALKASLEAYGMVKLSDSSAVTDLTGLALPATEKNASIKGTLANQISQLNTDYITGYKTDSNSYASVIYGDNIIPINEVDQVRCVKLNNGLKCITGSFVASDEIHPDNLIMTLPDEFSLAINGTVYQKWIQIISCNNGISYNCLFLDKRIIGWGGWTIPKGEILSIYLLY